MLFLMRKGVWVGALLVILSYFSNQSSALIDGNNPLNVGEAVNAATEAYNYVSALCTEKPEVCEKGGEAISALGVRATEGARVAYELLDKQFGAKAKDTALISDPEPTPFPVTASVKPADMVFTGTVPVPQKRPTH